MCSGKETKGRMKQIRHDENTCGAQGLGQLFAISTFYSIMTLRHYNRATLRLYIFKAGGLEERTTGGLKDSIIL